MGQSIPDNILRSEFLRLAGEPGCIICSAARAAVDRFFAWYIIEQYHEPSTIQRMQEARGFCPEHTCQFVAISSPHLVTASRVDGVPGSARRRCYPGEVGST